MRDPETVGVDTPASGTQQPEPTATERPSRIAQVVVALLAIGLAFFAGIRMAPRFSDGPTTHLPKRIAANVGHSKRTDEMVRRLRADGVIVRQPVEDALDALLWWYDKRPDLQPSLSDPTGRPDPTKLVWFAGEVQDATAVSLVPYQPAILELKGRLGMVDVQQPDITQTLFWLFANRPDPKIDTDGTIAVIAQFWRDRPEERPRFVAGGRLQLLPLLFWGFSLPSDDPSYELFGRIAYQLEQLPAEFE
jgi:hypothetical protein